MKRFTFTIALLIIFCSLFNAVAETTTRGKIELDMPNAPTPKVEVNLDKTFFALFINLTAKMPEYTEYAEMIEGVFVRAYEKENPNLDKLTQHYREILKQGAWENLIRAKDKLHVSLLFAEKPGIVNGIFIIATDNQDTSFVNIYGQIDFHKLGILFGKIIEKLKDSDFSEFLEMLGENGTIKFGMGDSKSKKKPKEELNPEIGDEDGSDATESRQQHFHARQHPSSKKPDFEQLRNTWIAEVGDIPEVDVVIETMKRANTDAMTIDDAIKMQKAVLKITQKATGEEPHEMQEHLKRLQRIKLLHLLGVPVDIKYETQEFGFNPSGVPHTKTTD